jgi:hypothetical protein
MRPRASDGSLSVCLSLLRRKLMARLTSFFGFIAVFLACIDISLVNLCKLST